MALIPHGSRIYCNKDITPSVVISDNDTLIFSIDGINYEVGLIGGLYESDHYRFESTLPDMFNQVFTANGLPLLCRLGGIKDDNPRTVLVFEHTDFENHHLLDIVGGTAFDKLVENVYDFDENLDGTFLRVKDQLSKILVVYPAYVELSADVTLRQNNKTEVSSDISVRKSVNSSLLSAIKVNSASLLNANIAVRAATNADLSGTIGIPTDGYLDLGSFLIVRK